MRGDDAQAHARVVRTRWWLAVAAVAVVLLVALVTAGSTLGDVTFVAAGVALTGAFGLVARRRDLQPVRAWSTLWVGLLLMAVGEALYVLPVDTEVLPSGLTLADPLYLAGSVALVAGALRLKGAHVGERDREALLDALSVAVATTALLWHPLIAPRFVSDVSVAGRVISGSYPVFDVVVAAMFLWVVLGTRRRSPASLLLVGASLVYLAADLGYTVRIDRGLMDDPGLAWLDTTCLLAYGLYLLAALHPSAVEVDRATPVEDHGLSKGRLAVSGMALLAPISALALSGAGGEGDDVALALLASTVLVVLVLVRIGDLAARERRARQAVLDKERYFRSLVEHASEAVLVLDGDGVVRDASPAVQPLLGLTPDELVGHRPGEVVGGLDRAVVEEMLTTATARPGVVITGEVAVRGLGGTTWLEMRSTNLLRESAVQGLVVNLHDVTARRQVQVDLERRAFTDNLTGLANRALFLDRLSQLVDRRRPAELAVVYCDLDRFKQVNDTFGHGEGDRLLEAVGARLTAAVRSEDTVARLGGDEFAVLVHGPEAPLFARRIADRIVDDLRRPVLVAGEPVPVAVSVGVACAGRDADDADTLLRRADEAMYRAKRAGGDRVVVLGSCDPPPAAGLDPSALPAPAAARG